jgi:hypothetical protein
VNLAHHFDERGDTVSAAVTAITAVIFVPKAELTLYLAACLAYCTAEGYFHVGTVTESIDVARREARRLGAAVIVVARREHADAATRIEVAGEARGRTPDVARPNSVRRRRPRRV